MLSPSNMGFLKHQDLWVTRFGMAALVFGAFVLLKFLLDSETYTMSLTSIGGFTNAVTPMQRAEALHCGDCSSNNPAIISSFTSVMDPNSFLPCKDYVKAGSSTLDLDVAKYFKTSVEDSELLHAAQDAATRPLAAERPRVAFLFILRQKIPLETVWERFFAGADKKLYSIYTHASWWVDEFPNTSVFHNRSVSTKEVARFNISLVDVVRRLLAFALLDTARANMWFAFVSEACAPVRGFPYVYDYFMNSNTSFVEAYPPLPRFKRWNPTPLFRKDQLRKGELWMSMHRRHAGMVVGDMTFYRKFKQDCVDDCTLDEEYTQTLLSVLDPTGIANRSVTYVDWSNPNHGASPATLVAANITAEFFRKVQNRTENLDGQYIDSSDDYFSHATYTMQTCVYNGQPHSPCFLFARKFSGETQDVEPFASIPATVLGY